MADHLLEVRNLSVEFHTAMGVVKAVRDISYHLDRGETLAILGESGSGKSVSSSAIMNLIDMPPGRISSGEILLNGVDLLTMPAHQRRAVNGRRIAMIFQDPLSHLNPVYTVGWQIREALTTHGTGSAEAQAEALRLVTRVGIPDPERALDKYPHEFSGGQRQRVMIAMALANEPKLLIADEPTTALDVTVQAQILELLANLKAKKGMSMLFITHDLGIVRKVADRVCVMTHGKIVETGPTAEIFANPQHEYTRHLLAAEPKGAPPSSDPSAEIVMEGQQVRVWFPIKRGFFRKLVGHVKAVDGIDVTVRAGQTLGVVGESGSGKTTLGLALSRLISSKGRIRFNGRDIDALSFNQMRPLRRELQIVFQDPYGSLSPRMSVSEIVEEGLTVHQPSLSRDQRDALVVSALKEVGLDPATRFRYPHEFSGGQRQRIAIARAILRDAPLLLLDEATSSLDAESEVFVQTALEQLMRHRTTLVIAHRLATVLSCDRILVMEHGRIVEQGTHAQLVAKGGLYARLARLQFELA